MDKILSYLGIARRAGYLISGTDAVIASIKASSNSCSKQEAKAKLVLIASDASTATKDKIINKCYFYQVKYLDVFTTIDLAKATGLENPKVVAITNQGIASQIIKLN